jgi:hypothetical protein
MFQFISKRSDFRYSPCDSDDDAIVTRSAIVGEYLKLWWIVPKGFLSDGQSMPRVLWPILGHPLENESIRAACLHDRYYKRPDGRLRDQIDRMFYEAMIADGVCVAEAKAKYRAVRWFGWFAWRRHRAGDKG